MPDNSAEIAELEAVLNDAVTETQVGATKTKIDLKAAERRLAYLQETDDSGNYTPKKKVVRLNLS